MKLKVLFFLFVVSLSYGTNTNPTNHITYKVVRNDEVIGTIQITCNTQNDSKTYSLESKITAKYIFKFNITGKETSIYKNGVLVYSSVFRKLNNKIKANHTIVYDKEQYHLKLADELERLDFNKIQQNLVTLYFNEPKGVTSIFCDNQKEMVKLQALGNGRYKVDFLNGKYNIFHYENGRCIKIEANSNLFNVTLIPA
jgi:hypothetical protein